MANSREKRERYSTFGGVVKSKLTSKWEVVLVFVIVAAGVVITTIAAVKSKEKSDTNTKDDNINGNTEVITSLSNQPKSTTELVSTKLNELKPNYNQNQNQRPHQSIPELDVDNSQTDAIINNPNRRAPNINREEDDYETLGERIDTRFHSSNLEPITSESNERRMETMHTMHDGLPGYPGPRDASLAALFRNKAELTADGAGFLIDDNYKSNGPVVVRQAGQDDQRNEPSPVSQADEIQNSDENRQQSRHQEQLVKQINEQLASKYKEKQMMAANSYPSQYSSEYSADPTVNRPSHDMHRKAQQMQSMPAINMNHGNQNDRRPQLIFTNMDHSQHLPLFEHIKPVNGLPLAISIPRRIPITHPSHSLPNQQHHHPSTQRTPNNIGASTNINPKRYPTAIHPLFLSHFSADTQLQRRKRTVNTVNEPQQQPNANHHQTDNETKDGHRPESLHTAAASDYFKFDSDDKDQKSIFNYDSYPSKERRKLSASNRSGTRKHSGYGYFPTAASNNYQYGILGSGNFEIIRGGTFNNDEIASSDNNYIREQSNRYQNTDDYDDAGNEEITKYPGAYSDEEDFFSNNPVLGFQGYDNFQAATGDKSRTSSEDRGHNIENSSQPSQQVPVYMDQDLMATS